MSLRRLSVLVFVLALAATLIVACGGGGTAGSGSSSGAQTVTLTAGDDLKWSPTTLNLKAGQAYTISLVNNGKLDHSFVVPDLNVKVQMPAGKTVQTNLTVQKAGSYQFVCDVPGHKEAGMVGTLTVQ